MIYKIYIIGLILMIIWWAILAIMVFERNIYDKLDKDSQNRIDDLRFTLEEFKNDNLQVTYFFISLFVSFLWPIVVPYILFQRIKDKF